MKKLLLSLFLVSLLAACTNNTKPATENAADAAYAKNLATAKEYFAAFAAKDSTKMASLVTDDFKWTPPAVGMDSLSKATWFATMKTFMNTYNDITFTNQIWHRGVDSAENFDGSVRVYGIWKSKFASSGKITLLKYYATMDFNAEGKLVSQIEYYNTPDLTIER